MYIAQNKDDSLYTLNYCMVFMLIKCQNWCRRDSLSWSIYLWNDRKFLIIFEEELINKLLDRMSNYFIHILIRFNIEATKVRFWKEFFQCSFLVYCLTFCTLINCSSWNIVHNYILLAYILKSTTSLWGKHPFWHVFIPWYTTNTYHAFCIAPLQYLAIKKR